MILSGTIVYALFLTYSVIFYYKIQTLGARTSVFSPFYYAYYTNTNAALIAFVSGLVLATASLIA